MTYCKNSNQDKYPFILPKLPYDKNSFTPYFTAETFDYHHGMHHNAYVTNLNNLLKDNTEMQSFDLEQIIQKSYKNNNAIFNNAAQIWNHSFFWHSMKPNGGGQPKGAILDKINQDFGSYDVFVKKFIEAALTQFGSGWAWLILNKNNKLEIIKTANAETPLTLHLSPLIACDVWEHAYYIDFRNKRPDYVNNFLNHMINWDFATIHMTKHLNKM